MLLSTAATAVCPPTNSAQGLPSPTSSPAFAACSFIDDNHSKVRGDGSLQSLSRLP